MLAFVKNFLIFLAIIIVSVTLLIFLAKTGGMSTQSLGSFANSLMNIPKQLQLATAGTTNSINQSTQINTFSVSHSQRSNTDWKSSIDVSDGDKIAFQLHYFIPDQMVAQNIRAYIEDLTDRTFHDGDSETVNGRLTASNLSTSSGTARLDFEDDVELTLYNVSWQDEECNHVGCESNFAGNYQDVISSSGLLIGNVSSNGSEYYRRSGNVIIEFVARELESEQKDPADVETEDVNDIDADSARLYGEVTSGDRIDVWFVIDDDSSVSCFDSIKYSVDGQHSTNDDFSRKISNLRVDTKYYYRACGDDDGDTLSGSLESFRTDTDEPETREPDATTFKATNIEAHYANLNGEYDGNGAPATVYFEYGRTDDLGKETRTYSKGSGRDDYTHNFTNLASDTTYYYRAVVTTRDGTARGEIKSFRTLTDTPKKTNVSTTTTKKTIIVKPPEEKKKQIVDDVCVGYGSSPIRLDIDNDVTILTRGAQINYNIEWENISASDVQDTTLVVSVPDGMEITGISSGQIADDRLTAIVNIGDIDSQDSDNVSVYAKASRGVGSAIVSATISFENPRNGARENITDYDSDTFGANVTGSTGSGWGILTWIFIVLLIIILILLIRWLLRELRSDDQQTITSVQDDDVYVPYRPDNT